MNKHTLRDLWEYNKRYNFMSLKFQKEEKNMTRFKKYYNK